MSPLKDPWHSSTGTTSTSDQDESGILTPTTTTSEVTLADFGQNPTQYTSCIPSHGSTVMIRSLATGEVITLLKGNVVLAPKSDRGSFHWEVVESEGWLGFRDPVSNKFICHGRDARLKCTAKEGDSWRQITLTPVPKGGYVMQMLDWWVLRPIVVNPENGLQKLGRTGDKLADGVVWEFLDVD